MRLQHEYYSRLKGGHGVRDIIGAYTELKTTEEDKTKLATNKGYVDVSNGLVCLCASLSNCGGIVDSLCSRKGGERERGPSHRERENARSKP